MLSPDAMAAGRRPPPHLSQVSRGRTKEFAEKQGALGISLMNLVALITIICAIPAIVGIVVAGHHWHDDCRQPLQWWLVLDGGIVVLGTLVNLTCALCTRQWMKSQVLMEYIVRRQRGDDVQDDELEAQLAECDNVLQFSTSISHCIGISPAILYIAGFAAYITSDNHNCEPELRAWVRGLLIFQTAAVVTTLCCAFPVVMLLCEHTARSVGPADEAEAELQASIGGLE
mmetsp:Transcript_29284/g.67427  ORF Transcript_29284/g.67427 Transcript_29284/m.67427 type:complete len:229 (-) Transcript_29284:256-942(-)